MNLLARFKRDAVATAVIASLALGAFGFVAVTPKDGGYTQLDLAAKKCKKKDQKNKKCKKKKSTASPRPTGTTAPSPTASGAPTPAPTGSAPPGGGGPSTCTGFTPFADAAEAETTVLTDAATEDAPVTVEIETHEGLGAGRDGGLAPLVSHQYHNVVADTKNPSVGVWATVHFTPAFDYDLYFLNTDGETLAVSGGTFVVEDGFTDGGGDSDSGLGTETVTGVETAKCNGYSIDVVGAVTSGETVTLDLWLGEVVFTPGAEASATAPFGI